VPTLPAKYVQIDGHAVHYLHTGRSTLPGVPPPVDQGQLFVLLHGAGGSAALWQRQLTGLGERHSVVALDSPAHGRSNGVAGLASIDAHVDLLTRFAGALDLRPFVLVGHSLGATIAVAFAARHAALVRGLVLIAPTLQADCAAAITSLREVVMGRLPQQFSPEFFSPGTAPTVMREFFTAYVTTDPRVRLCDLEAAHGFDGAPLCRSIATPTLVLAGADDQIVPATASAAVAAAIPGARFESIAAAGHALALEQPGAVNTAMASFAEGLQ
jgi:pimeloyl-ACP methyl ester carboxylesterase